MCLAWIYTCRVITLLVCHKCTVLCLPWPLPPLLFSPASCSNILCDNDQHIGLWLLKNRIYEKKTQLAAELIRLIWWDRCRPPSFALVGVDFVWNLHYLVWNYNSWSFFCVHSRFVTIQAVLWMYNSWQTWACSVPGLFYIAHAYFMVLIIRALHENAGAR